MCSKRPVRQLQTLECRSVLVKEADNGIKFMSEGSQCNRKRPEARKRCTDRGKNVLNPFNAARPACLLTNADPVRKNIQLTKAFSVPLQELHEKKWIRELPTIIGKRYRHAVQQWKRAQIADDVAEVEMLVRIGRHEGQRPKRGLEIVDENDKASVRGVDFDGGESRCAEGEAKGLQFGKMYPSERVEKWRWDLQGQLDQLHRPHREDGRKESLVELWVVFLAAPADVVLLHVLHSAEC